MIKQPKNGLLSNLVMTDLIRYFLSPQVGFSDRRSRVERGMTGMGE